MSSQITFYEKANCFHEFPDFLDPNRGVYLGERIFRVFLTTQHTNATFAQRTNAVCQSSHHKYNYLADACATDRQQISSKANVNCRARQMHHMDMNRILRKTIGK